MGTKERIIALLLSTKREGMDSLIDYLVKGGFFESPASTRFHGCYEGGLAEHSINLYDTLATNYPLSTNDVTGRGQKPLPADASTYVIVALLHDICKIGAYVRTKADDGWTSNRNKDKGHALLSIARIKEYIELTQLEEMMIKYHMGVYGTVEFDEKSGEYPLRGDSTKSSEERYGQSLANAWYHNPIVKVMYFCDELETLGNKLDK